MPETAFTADEVALFYDRLEEFFSAVLGESIHYGYWPADDPGADLSRAQDHLTRLLGGKLGTGAGQHLLDVGCGTGRPAALIAGDTGCTITGITISGNQLAPAARRARDLGVDGQVSFQWADAMAMPFADGSFDAALALESLLHMPDKEQALAEIRRVLRPGARLVVADFFETSPIPPGTVPETAIGVLPNHVPPPLDELTGVVAAAGFTVTEVHDLTADAHRSGEAILAAIHDYRPRGGDGRIAEQVQQAIPAIVEHAHEHTGYVAITAEVAR